MPPRGWSGRAVSCLEIRVCPSYNLNNTNLTVNSHLTPFSTLFSSLGLLRGVLSRGIICLLLLTPCLSPGQSFTESSLNFNGRGAVYKTTSLMFGPDGRLYVLSLDGTIDIFSIERMGVNDYVVTSSEELPYIRSIPNHDDNGVYHDNDHREATGLTVTGTASRPVVYVTSSDWRVGGPTGDIDLDTNSGIITRLTWNGTDWEVVDIVRGLPRSEENHATNGLEFTTIDGEDFLIVCSGGHTNGGSPSKNFAWTTEYALSAAILSVNLTQLEAMPILQDTASNRAYVYDIPTLDDPSRPNANGIIDPDVPGYDGVDVGDPWGGNDGLNQAMVVEGGPVQIFSGGYRNAYDLVLTENGRVYVTDNGANGGWGGLPVQEGMDGTVTNDYISTEPGSSGQVGGEKVNNKDHLTLVTDDIQQYIFGSFYAGHPTPVRANPLGAGLFTNPTPTANENAVFRTLIYDPDGSRGEGYTSDPGIGLPANWPPVPAHMADIREGDWRGPGIGNPDGEDDQYVTLWSTNTNGIDEYTASNFDGAMKGDLLAGANNGIVRRVQLNPDGSLKELTESFISNLRGNSLGVTCNSDSDRFPGTVWIASHNRMIKVLEPQDFAPCYLPGDPNYTATGDNDKDGYTNQDEIDNKNDDQTVEEVICNGGSQPDDFDKIAGGTLISNLADPDDDNDGIPDAEDPFQLGDPLTDGSDAFPLPVINDMFSDNQELQGYLGLGFTGLMNNGAPNPNWSEWLDRRHSTTDPNPNDILGGAVGAMTMQMTGGTALGTANNQEKAFQYGVEVDRSTGTFTVEGRLFNFTDPLQLFGSSAPGNGELGIFVGDGTQSNYIKFVLTASGNLLARQEIEDVPATPVSASITVNQDIVLFFQIDATTGTVTLRYAADGGKAQTLGTLQAEGPVLNAIQNSSAPLAVGLIGTSNEPGLELEGTWDYLHVRNSQPYVQRTLPDIQALVNANDKQIDLGAYFGDDLGDGNLTYTVTRPVASAIGTAIAGDRLTISFPATPEVSEITVRATDQDNFSVTQTFGVTVHDEFVPVLRIRASGESLAAIDAPKPAWVGGLSPGYHSGQFSDLSYAVSTGGFATHQITDRHASLPDYVPQSLFTHERHDSLPAPDMEWSFGLPNGEYFVRLYLANGDATTSSAGQRVFDIHLQGKLVHDNLDLAASFGHQRGGMLEFPAIVDNDSLKIAFRHEVGYPLINGIEILADGASIKPPIVVNSIGDQNNLEGDLINLTVSASGGDANENFYFEATGLPPGVDIEPTTGLIFGTVAEGASAGSIYDATVKVSKAGSTPVTISFDWTVTVPKDSYTWHLQTDVDTYTARHECSFLQVGDRFYLFGGRENSRTLDVYDYQTKTWSQIPDSAPAEFNHFQAVEYQGLIWVIGAFKDNAYPKEVPADYVWAYNPATNEWIQGPEIPAHRRRGSAGLVIHQDKFYIIGGNIEGHNGKYVAFFDEFDPATGVWTALPDAPRPRDHFHAAVIRNKLYLAGGRLSGGRDGVSQPLIAEVDVYDFSSNTWSSAPELPTPRAAAAVGVLENELYVIGGEIGVDLNGNTVSDAVKTTEAYDPIAGTWSAKDDLNIERHGTQAIVSGDGIHVTAGSNTLGSKGTMRNMEYFGTDNPFGTPLSISQLQTPDRVGISPSSTENITIACDGGNTGIIITDVSITGTDADAFSLESPIDFALLKPGGSLNIAVGFNGFDPGKTATLSIAFGEAGTASVTLYSDVLPSGTVLYRINAGGRYTASNGADTTAWSADQSAAAAGGTALTGTPSPYYLTTPPAEDLTYGKPFTGVNQTGYPSELFSTERYSTAANPDNMQWDFPLDNGEYTVNLLFAETAAEAQTAGARTFGLLVENEVELINFDPTLTFGYNAAGVKSILTTVTDGNLDLDFVQEVYHPTIRGIEILSGFQLPPNDPPLVGNPGAQSSTEGDAVSLQINASDANPCTGLTYGATGLPPGLSIDPVLGLITGTVTEDAASLAADTTYSVVVKVADGCTPSLSVQTAFTWKVAQKPVVGNLTLTAVSQGRSNHAGSHSVALYLPENVSTPTHTYTPVADADGRMTVSGFPPGTYLVVVWRAGYLRQVRSLTITADGTTASFGPLIAGNLNDDNVIDDQDYSILQGGYGLSGKTSDLNGDGVTDILDFSLMASNYGLTGDDLTNTE